MRIIGILSILLITNLTVKSQEIYRGKLSIDLNKARSINYLKEISKNEYTDLTVYADKKYEINNVRLDPSISMKDADYSFYIGDMGGKKVGLIVGDKSIDIEIKDKNLMREKVIRTSTKFDKKKYEKAIGIENKGNYVLIDVDKNNKYELSKYKDGEFKCDVDNKDMSSIFNKKRSQVFPNQYVGKRTFYVNIWDPIAFNSGIFRYMTHIFYKSILASLQGSGFRDLRIIFTKQNYADVFSLYKDTKDSKNRQDILDKLSMKINSSGNYDKYKNVNIINSFNLNRNIKDSRTTYGLGWINGNSGIWLDYFMASWANYEGYTYSGKVTYTHEIGHNLGADHVSGDDEDVMSAGLSKYNTIFHRNSSNLSEIRKSLSYLAKEPAKTIDLGTINRNDVGLRRSGSTKNKGRSNHDGLHYNFPASNMVYKFKVSGDGYYAFDTQNAEYDTFIYLLDEMGNLIAKDDDGGLCCYWSRIWWQKLYKGRTYYAIVSGFSNREGKYYFVIWSQKGVIKLKSMKKGDDGIEEPSLDLRDNNSDNGYSIKDKGESNNKEELNLYPTLVKGVINIEKGNLIGNSFDIVIYDVKGNVVQSGKKQKWGEFKVNSDISDGLYIVKVETDKGEKFMKRIVVSFSGELK